MEADGVGADGGCEPRTNQPAAATPMTAMADAAINAGRLLRVAAGGAAADDVAPGMTTVAGAAATAGRTGAVSDSSARHSAIDCGRRSARTARPASMPASRAGGNGHLPAASGARVSSSMRSMALGGGSPVMAKCSVAARP